MELSEMSSEQKVHSLAQSNRVIVLSIVGLVISLIALAIGGSFTLLSIGWSGKVTKNEVLMLCGCFLFLVFIVLSIWSLNKGTLKRDELVLAIQNEEKKHNTIEKQMNQDSLLVNSEPIPTYRFIKILMFISVLLVLIIFFSGLLINLIFD